MNHCQVCGQDYWGTGHVCLGNATAYPPVAPVQTWAGWFDNSALGRIADALERIAGALEAKANV